MAGNAERHQASECFAIEEKRFLSSGRAVIRAFRATGVSGPANIVLISLRALSDIMEQAHGDSNAHKTEDLRKLSSQFRNRCGVVG